MNEETNLNFVIARVLSLAWISFTLIAKLNKLRPTASMLSNSDDSNIFLIRAKNIAVKTCLFRNRG